MSQKSPKKDKTPKPPSHQAEIHRINRLIGQLEGVRRMVEEQRYCPDILTQTRAAASALRGLETAILERHLRHCVAQALHEPDAFEMDAKISELMEIFQKRIKA